MRTSFFRLLLSRTPAFKVYFMLCEILISRKHKCKGKSMDAVLHVFHVTICARKSCESDMSACFPRRLFTTFSVNPCIIDTRLRAESTAIVLSQF